MEWNQFSVLDKHNSLLIKYDMIIMHPPRGPKGRGVAPIGAMRGVHYYAPPSRPEGPRRCPDRGNAGGALVFMYLFWLLYAMGVYT